jgi:nucleotide-binding universal stress UspA family protein
MICWNKSDNLSRTVVAVMPILKKATCVVFAHVAKRDPGEIEAIQGHARQPASIGISTQTRVVSARNGGIPGLLSAAAEDCKADLLVAGAYGHSRVHELIFGSCTEALIRQIDRPILLMH